MIDARFEGKVKFFNKEKGYGFIVGPGNHEVFFHITEVANNEVLDCRDVVTYFVKEGRKGPIAHKVALVKKAERVAPPKHQAERAETVGAT